MNLNSQFYFAFQNGWLPTFSQDVSNAIGGYPQGAVLWYQTDNGLQILQSTIPNNTNNFITNPSVIGTSWVTVGATQAYVQQGLSGKADTDLGNLSTAGKNLASGLGMPSNKYVNLTLGASGATYTAPANGYFYINANGKGNDNWIEMTNNSAAGFARGVYGTIAWSFKNALEAKGGDSVTIRYYNINTPAVFRFIYAEGEK